MSRALYFDARNTFNISSSTGKYNGGNNYAIALLKRLLSNDKVNVLIICPKNATDYVLNQYSISVDKLITESSLKNITFYDNSIYFYPLVSDTKHFLDELIYVKSNNPTLKIRLTIHDRRHHEDIIDKYNGILNEGIKHNYFILGVGRFINSIKKDIIVKKILHLSDEVFTVSNYSMQELLSLGNTNYISCYVQPIQFTNRTILVEGNYVLFVSAGRSEKNFIRALKAFEQYVKNKNDKDVRLRVLLLDGEAIGYFDSFFIWYEVGTGISSSNNKTTSKMMRNDQYRFFSYLKEAYNNSMTRKALRLYSVNRLENNILRKIVKILVHPDLIRFRIKVKTNLSFTRKKLAIENADKDILIKYLTINEYKE